MFSMDFVIVIVAIISIFTGPLATNFSCDATGGGGSILKALRSLRALRALRPLRVIRRYPGLKLVVNSIFKALPQIMNVAMVAALIFLIFAIVGVVQLLYAPKPRAMVAPQPCLPLRLC